jgi:hypothetical protein
MHGCNWALGLGMAAGTTWHQKGVGRYVVVRYKEVSARNQLRAMRPSLGQAYKLRDPASRAACITLPVPVDLMNDDTQFRLDHYSKQRAMPKGHN